MGTKTCPHKDKTFAYCHLCVENFSTHTWTQIHSGWFYSSIIFTNTNAPAVIITSFLFYLSDSMWVQCYCRDCICNKDRV